MKYIFKNPRRSQQCGSLVQCWSDHSYEVLDGITFIRLAQGLFQTKLFYILCIIIHQCYTSLNVTTVLRQISFCYNSFTSTNILNSIL